MSIRKKLIELLGGVPCEQVGEEWTDGNLTGQLYTAQRVREQMKACNGMSAEEWCDYIWSYVDALVKNLKQLEENTL